MQRWPRGINHTTVSRRIASLEKRLGGRVLAKATGGWELTDLGRQALTAAERVEALVYVLVTDPGGGDRRDARIGDVTNVFVHVEATLSYWLVARPESLRRTEVAASGGAIRETVESHRDTLLRK